MAGEKLRVGVIFGSRSVEHEVSIVTGLQVYHALDRAKYEPVPIYITKSGNWLSGEQLGRLDSYKDLKLMAAGEQAYLAPEPGRELVNRAGSGLLRRRQKLEVDVVFPCIHGTFGEDGTLQGLLELADVPYVGAGVVGSAVGMDKIIMKAAFQAAGLPVVRYSWLTRARWDREREAALDEIIGTGDRPVSLRYPLFVKPANLGSSVGISKAHTRAELANALDIAASYDRRLIVEEGVENAIEINCSVLGNDAPIASVCEQPVAWQEFLSYEDKYLRSDGGAKGQGQAQGMKGAARRIPAPISPELTARIQDLAIAAFRAVDCAGIARIDCLVDERSEQVYVNEINTIPGSLSFYLWEPSGVSFAELTDRLIQLALERHAEKRRNQYSYDSAILQKVVAGAKASRGVKS